MKKIVSLLLAISMVLTLAACGEKPAPAPKEVTYKLGMGVETSLGSSKTGNAQVDATVVAVVTDAEGKIVAVELDVAQNKTSVADGELTVTTSFPTKDEKKEAYNMKGASAIGKEWYEQAAAWEAYMVGKTLADVKAMTTHEHNGHQVADDEALYAVCSMQVTDFNAALVKALEDQFTVEFTVTEGTEFKLGLACTTTDDGSTPVTEEKDGTVKMYTEFGAAVVVDGKVAACLTDMIQPTINFNAEGEITACNYRGTKRELLEGYNMKPVSGIGKEWYEQAAAFVAYCVGKTPAEIAALTTEEKNGHQVSTDEALYAVCSMQIVGMRDVIAKACNK